MSSVRPMQRTRGPCAAAARTSSSGPRRGRGCGSGAAAPPGGGGASARARPWRRRRARGQRRSPDRSSSAWTKPRAPRCMPSCSSHSPQSETPMSPIPIASVTLAPQPSSSVRAERGLAAARLACDEHPLDARAAEVDVPLRRPLDEVRGVRGREHDGLGLEQLDRPDEPLGVTGPDGDVAEADPVERGQCGARDEGPGVVGRDDSLAGGDARGGVAARRARHPVLEVARGQRDVAGRAGRPARRVDPHDLGGRGAEVRADGVVGRGRRAQLAASP